MNKIVLYLKGKSKVAMCEWRQIATDYDNWINILQEKKFDISFPRIKKTSK